MFTKDKQKTKNKNLSDIYTRKYI